MNRAVFLMAAVPLAALAAGVQAAETAAPAVKKSFNSTLPFSVVSFHGLFDDPVSVGHTPAKQPIEIPECLYWCVEPEANLALDKAAAELKKQKVAGLRFSRASVTDADFAKFKDVTSLEAIDFCHTKVGDGTLVALKGMKALRILRLANTDVSDSGLAALRELPKLEVLDLTTTDITDAGLKHLAGMKQLKTVLLEASQATAGGVGVLRKSLPDAEILGP